MAFNEDDDITEMKSLDVDRVDAVGSPANGTNWLVLKAGAGSGGGASYIVGPAVGGAGTSVSVTIGDTTKAKYSAEQLRKLYKQGHAMKGPHGNIDYPIADDEDLHNAIHAVGRGNADHGKIRRYIKRRAKALGHTDWIPDSWASKTTTEEGGWHMSKHANKAAPAVPADEVPAVHDAPDASNPIGESHVSVSSTPPGPTGEADGAPQTDPSPSAAASLPADGQGSSLGSQSTDPDALAGQTRENCAPVSGGSSDQQDRQDRQAQKASKKGKKKRKMHNPQHPDTDADPDAQDASKAAGDAHWEHTDVQLGQTTIDHLRQALAAAQEFTHREQTEAQDAAAVKETIQMTPDELVRLADMIGSAAKADAEKGKKDKKAAKAAKRIAELEERLAKVETQPQRSRPVLSGASGPVDGSDALKEIRDRVDAATARNDVSGVMRAAKQLSTAKLISIETARREGRLPQPAGLPDGATPVLTGSHLLPADPRIRGI